MRPTWNNTVHSVGLSRSMGGITPNGLYQLGQEQADIWAVDGLDGVVSIPDSSTQWEGCGVFGGVLNASPVTNAVAGRFYGIATGDGAKIWGINALLKDGSVAKNFANVLLLNEWDFNANNPSTKIIAHSIGGASSVQPAQALGYTCNTLGGAGTSGIRWEYGFGTMDGAAAVGVVLGTMGGDGVPSQPICMFSRSSEGIPYLHQLQGDASSNFQISTPGCVQFNAGGRSNVANINANGIALGAGKYFSFGTDARGSAVTTLGSASPASVAVPYTWLKVQAPDGAMVYIPAWR